MHRPEFRLLLTFAAALAAAPVTLAQNQPDYEKPPINYSLAEPNDSVSRLRSKISAGQLRFDGDERQQLRALLQALDVPVESQVLVFSRTSLQRGRIRPSRPRALYFSDSVYVGWVPGGLFEVAAIDPHLGPVFYALDLREGEGGSAQPKFTRDSDCLRCHGGTFVRDIPGVFARSVFPSSSGEPVLRFGTEVVDDETPFAHRWGGWYVTGYTGQEDHRGNLFSATDEGAGPPPTTSDRPQELSMFFDTADYLAATSDVVALLVLEHQMTVQNALTRAAINGRKMIAYQHSLQKTFGEPQTDEPAFDSVKSVFASAVEDVVDRLLFRNAAPLPEGVVGHRGFLDTFPRSAPRSRAGHSLKDLALDGRIFRHRCSFLIYSDSFRQLPAPLKQRIVERLRSALQDDSPKSRYAYLPAAERQAIREILTETHPDFSSQPGLVTTSL